MNKIVPYAVLLFILAFGLGILFSTVFDVATITPDAVQYNRIAKNIAFGNGFSLEDKFPYRPTMFREPLYPYFLSLIYKVFGYKNFAVLIVQSAIHGISSVLTLILGTMLFNRRIGILGGFFTAINITLASFCAYLLTETLFAFLILCLALCFCAYLKSRKPVLAIFGSFIAGLCVLTKAGSMFLIFFILLGILIYRLIQRDLKLLKFIAISILAITIVMGTILPWSIRNKKAFNTYSLTYRIGVHLYSRASKVSDSAEKVFITSIYNVSEFLGYKLFPLETKKANQFLYKGLWMGERIKNQYIQEGMSPERADKMVFRDAANIIFKHPIKYILYTPVEGLKLLSFSYIPVLNEDFIIKKISSVKNGQILLIGIRTVMKIYGFFLFFLSTALVFRRKKFPVHLIIIVSIICYFTAVYILTDAYARYFVVFIPFFTIMSLGFLTPDHRRQ